MINFPFNFSLFSSSLHEDNALEYCRSSVVYRGLLRIVSNIPSPRASAFPFYDVLETFIALFIGLKRGWCFFEKRNSISVDLSRYWNKFLTMSRSIRNFSFPHLGKLNSWKLFPSNPSPPPPPPGATIMFKFPNQVHFLKKENLGTVTFHSFTRL